MGILDRAKEMAAQAGGAIADRAKSVDLSGVTERVSGAYRATVDAAGDVVDAAGNRVTHPSKAFDEGFEACRMMWRGSDRDAADDSLGYKKNPYE